MTGRDGLAVGLGVGILLGIAIGQSVDASQGAPPAPVTTWTPVQTTPGKEVIATPFTPDLTTPAAPSSEPTPTVSVPAPTPPPTAAPPSQKATGRPTAAPTATQRVATGNSVTGTASWYCGNGSPCTRGVPSGSMAAAAGPALRVGAWRGRVVTVTANGRSVRVRLVDWMANRERVADLYASVWAALGVPLSRGVVSVRVSW